MAEKSKLQRSSTSKKNLFLLLVGQAPRMMTNMRNSSPKFLCMHIFFPFSSGIMHLFTVFNHFRSMLTTHIHSRQKDKLTVKHKKERTHIDTSKQTHTQ